MESYGSIDERSAATPPKFGRRIIAAVAAVALVVGASVAVSVMPPDRVHRERWHHVPGRPVREVWRRGYDRAAAGVLLPAGPASDSRPQLCVEIKILRGPTHGLICAQVPKARCAKGINGLTDCTDLCRKFPNAPHTTTCCKCYPAC